LSLKPHHNEKYTVAFKKQVIAYFKTHTARECAEKFKLSHTQIIGVLEMSRRNGLMCPTFKDKRTKKPWTLDELLFVIRHSGVRPRLWMGKQLGRGGARVIKERLRTLNSGTKWLNGMPKKWAEELWGNVSCGIKTDAGPPGGSRGNFHFIVVPWTDCEKLASLRETHDNVRIAVRAMAKFQKWIHGVNDPSRIRRKLMEGLRK